MCHYFYMNHHVTFKEIDGGWSKVTMETMSVSVSKRIYIWNQIITCSII